MTKKVLGVPVEYANQTTDVIQFKGVKAPASIITDYTINVEVSEDDLPATTEV